MIGQHIAEGFLGGLVDWLSSISKIPVKIAEHHEEIRPSQIYVCPVEKNTVVVEPGVFELLKSGDKELYRPSLDLLVSSMANVYRNKAIGVILTGMGTDGARGMKRIFDFKGYTIAQDEKTSTVFGMPKAAIELGAAKEILPLDLIPKRLIEICCGMDFYEI